MIRNALTILILLTTAISQGFSQGMTGEKRLLTLEDCLYMAKQKNYDIQLSEERIKAADARLLSGFGSYLPSLNFNMGFQRQLNAEGGRVANISGQLIPLPPQEPNSYSIGAYANYTIFDGFSREAVYDNYQQNYEAAVHNSDQTRNRVELQVYKQYIDIISQRQVVKIRREDLVMAKNELKRIRAQYEAGVVPITNVYAQEAEIGNKELDLVRAENQLDNAKAKLLTTIGLTPDISVEFVESSLPSTVDQDEIDRFNDNMGSLEAGIRHALNHRKDFAAAADRKDAAEYAVQSAGSGYLPRLTATGGWSWNHNRFANFEQFGRSYLGLNLSYPLFDRFRTNNDIQQANLSLRQREIEQLQMEQSIMSEVKTAYLNLRAAEKQIEITKKTLKSAEKSYASTKERYQSGAANITEFLYSGNQLIKSQINRVTTVYNYIKAQKQVLYAIGKL